MLLLRATKSINYNFLMTISMTAVHAPQEFPVLWRYLSRTRDCRSRHSSCWGLIKLPMKAIRKVWRGQKKEVDDHTMLGRLFLSELGTEFHACGVDLVCQDGLKGGDLGEEKILHSLFYFHLSFNKIFRNGRECCTSEVEVFLLLSLWSVPLSSEGNSGIYRPPGRALFSEEVLNCEE